MYKYKYRGLNWKEQIGMLLAGFGGVGLLIRLGSLVGVMPDIETLDYMKVVVVSGIVTIVAHEGVHIAFAKLSGVHPRLRFWRSKVLGFGLGVYFPGERLTVRQLCVVLIGPQLLTVVALVVVFMAELSIVMSLALWMGMTINVMSSLVDMSSLYRALRLPKSSFVEIDVKASYLYTRDPLSNESWLALQ